MILQKLGYIIIHFIMQMLGLISAVLPKYFRGKAGELFGLFMCLFGKSRRRIAMQNISLAFPEKSLRMQRQIMINSFKNLGITFLEVAALKFLNREQVKEVLKLADYHIINDAVAKGNGVIMLSGHYGNWEYLALAAGIYTNIPITIVVKQQKNPYVNNAVNSARTKFGNKVVPMTQAARSLIKALRSNEAVALLVDQSAKHGKDVFINFFGKPALTFEAPAELALRFRTPIVYAFPVRNKNYTYSAVLKELDFSDLEYSKENVTILTKRHVAILEEQIRAYPDYWAWQHRRWKHSLSYKL